METRYACLMAALISVAAVAAGSIGRIAGLDKVVDGLFEKSFTSSDFSTEGVLVSHHGDELFDKKELAETDGYFHVNFDDANRLASEYESTLTIEEKGERVYDVSVDVSTLLTETEHILKDGRIVHAGPRSGTFSHDLKEFQKSAVGEDQLVAVVHALLHEARDYVVDHYEGDVWRKIDEINKKPSRELPGLSDSYTTQVVAKPYQRSGLFGF